METFENSLIHHFPALVPFCLESPMEGPLSVSTATYPAASFEIDDNTFIANGSRAYIGIPHPRAAPSLPPRVD